MKTCIDHNKVNWFAQLSNIASIGGLALLLGSVLLPLFLPKLANYALWMMILGLGVAMVGIFFANRWVKKPRPEAVLDKALKSLTDTYHLFHYPALPSDHILLTPNGVVLLETINLSGSFSYKDGRWKESMSIGRALRFIVEEHLGDPIKSTRLAEKTLRGKFPQEITAGASIPIKSIIVFTHPAVLLEIKDAPIPVCPAEKLRKLVAIDAPKLEEGIYEKLDTFFIGSTRRDN
jgi:hypothetical protein